MILKESFAAYTAYQAKQDKLEKQIEKKQAQLRKLQNSKKDSWIKAVLEPFAKAMMVHLGRSKYDILGPFGLGSETSIWFFDTDKEREDCNIDSLTVRPDLFQGKGEEENPFGIKIKDYKNKLEEYQKNSIGERNGFNYPSIVPPADADLDWFKQYISWASDKTPVK